MNILICGSKTWNNKESIENILGEIPYPELQTVYHKLEPGLSLLGKIVAEQLGMKTEVWNGDLEEINYVFAFHPFIRNSVATSTIIGTAKARGIQYRIVNK